MLKYLFLILVIVSCKNPKTEESKNLLEGKLKQDIISYSDKCLLSHNRLNGNTTVSYYNNKFFLIFTPRNNQFTIDFVGEYIDPDHGYFYFKSNCSNVKYIDEELDIRITSLDIYNFPINLSNYNNVYDSIKGGANTEFDLNCRIFSDSVLIDIIKPDDLYLPDSIILYKIR